MPKKTTILILILAIVTGVLVFLAVTNQGQKPAGPTFAVPTKAPVERTAVLMFNPQNVDISAGTTSAQSVNIIVDTGKDSIAGVQTELQFDPKALTNVKLSPIADSTSFFGPTAVVLFNDVNVTTGRVSYAIAINAGQAPVKGIGKIATLSFQKAATATSSSTTISFLEKTLVTILGENDSVLKSAAPLNIILSQATMSPAFVPVTILPTTTL